MGRSAGGTPGDSRTHTKTRGEARPFPLSPLHTPRGRFFPAWDGTAANRAAAALRNVSLRCRSEITSAERRLDIVTRGSLPPLPELTKHAGARRTRESARKRSRTKYMSDRFLNAEGGGATRERFRARAFQTFNLFDWGFRRVVRFRRDVAAIPDDVVLRKWNRVQILDPLIENMDDMRSN